MSGRDDKSVLQVNAFIELSGFTPAMFDYRLGNRSALDWVVESYRVKTDARSGLVSDPNRSDDPNFISDGDRVRQQEPRRRLPARAASLVYQAVFQRRRFIYATLLKKSEVRAHVNSAKPYQTLTFALPRKGELWVTMKHSLARRAPRPLSALLVAGLLLCVPALAQPGGGPGMGGPGMNDQGGGRGGRGGDRSAMQAQMITRSLQSAGFTDQALITAVTTYVTDRQTARKPLFDAANALSAALTDENTTDAQMDALWSDFQAALATEKTRTATAESELDKRIGISKDSALAAALTLLGVTGDANGYLNAGQGGRGGGRGGQGGPGGPDGMGGGRGGGPGDN